MQTGTAKNDKGVEEEFLITGSRDQSLITWQITEKPATDEDKEWGIPQRVFNGHNHFVQDLALANNSQYALTASWDHTLRLWDLSRGTCTKTFVDHEKDALTCSFSADNKHIASGARDKTFKVWQTVGIVAYTSEQDSHDDWVSCVRYSPDTKNNVLATASWDGTVKVWDASSMNLQNTFTGHTNAVTSLSFAQKSCYLASGGKDGSIILWNVQEGSHLKHLTHNAPINQVLFSKNKYWIVAATDNGVLLWDLVSDELRELKQAFVHEDAEETTGDDEDKKEEKEVKVTEKKPVPCLSLSWSANENYLYTGWADNKVRVYEVHGE